MVFQYLAVVDGVFDSFFAIDGIVAQATLDTIKVEIPTVTTSSDPADALPGQNFMLKILYWISVIAGICAVGSLMIIGVMMMVGRRQRSQASADALAGLPWVVGGLTLVTLAAQIVSQIMS